MQILTPKMVVTPWQIGFIIFLKRKKCKKCFWGNIRKKFISAQKSAIFAPLDWVLPVGASGW